LAVLTSAIDRGREHEAVPRFTGRALNMRSMVRREVFDLAGSRTDNAEAAELGRRSGFPLVEIQAGIDLAFTDLLAQDLRPVVDALPRLWDATAATQGFHQWLMTGRLQVLEAEVALASGRVDRAHRAALTALRHASATGRPKHQISARRVLGAALAARGDREQALAESARAVAAARRLGHLPTSWTTLAAAAAVSEAVGRAEDAQQLRAAAAATVTAFTATLPDDVRAYVLRARQVRAVLDPEPALR
jgi:ATP/maltotriose-dependent transcriptional regulator MalT